MALLCILGAPGSAAAGLREDEAETQYVLGLGHQELDQPAEAIAYYSKAIELHPSHVNAYHGRGVVRAQTGDTAGAIEDFTKALELNPAFTKAYLNRALLFDQRKDFTAAAADYSAALRLAPENAGTYWQRGLARQHSGELPGAIEDFTKALELDGYLGKAYRSRAQARLAQGDEAGAIEDYTAQIGLRYRVSQGYADRAAVHDRRGEPVQAVADYTHAIEAEPAPTPADASVHLARAEAYRKQGNNDAALTDYDAAIGMDPSNASAYWQRADLRLQRQEFAQAIEDYTAGLHVGSDMDHHHAAVVYLRRGTARQRSGDAAGAEADYGKAIGQDRSLADAYRHRAALRWQSAKLSDAADDYGKALALAPDPAASMARCAIRVQLSLWAGAAEDCTDALDADGKNAEAYNQRAAARWHLGKREAAVADLEQAVRFAPPSLKKKLEPFLKERRRELAAQAPR